jgi:hypothetical protein
MARDLFNDVTTASTRGEETLSAFDGTTTNTRFKPTDG